GGGGVPRWGRGVRRGPPPGPAAVGGLREGPPGGGAGGQAPRRGGRPAAGRDRRGPRRLVAARRGAPPLVHEGSAPPRPRRGEEARQLPPAEETLADAVHEPA